MIIPPPIAANNVTAVDGDNKVNSEFANASSVASTIESTATAPTSPVSGITQNASSHHIPSRVTRAFTNPLSSVVGNPPGYAPKSSRNTRTPAAAVDTYRTAMHITR